MDEIKERPDDTVKGQGSHQLPTFTLFRQLKVEATKSVKVNGLKR